MESKVLNYLAYEHTIVRRPFFLSEPHVPIYKYDGCEQALNYLFKHFYSYCNLTTSSYFTRHSP